MPRKKLNNRLIGRCLEIVQDFLKTSSKNTDHPQSILALLEFNKADISGQYQIVCDISHPTESFVVRFVVDIGVGEVRTMEIPHA